MSRVGRIYEVLEVLVLEYLQMAWRVCTRGVLFGARSVFAFIVIKYGPRDEVSDDPRGVRVHGECQVLQIGMGGRGLSKERGKIWSRSRASLLL